MKHPDEVVPEKPVLAGTGAYRRRQTALVLLGAVLLVTVSALSAWWLRGRSADTDAPASDLSDKQTLKRGRLLYQVNCVSCHGLEGRGDGPSATELNPPPRDLALGPWRHGTRASEMRRTIRDGIPGTAMPGSSLLSPADLDALVAFVATLAPKEEEPSTLTEELQALLRVAGFTPESAPRPAVALKLCDLEGREHSLARERGRWVLLNFWSVTCTHCFEELPHLERLAEDLRTEGLTVLAICTDVEDPHELAALVRKHTRNLPVYFDPSSRTAQLYDVQVTPSSYLVDPFGRLVARARGMHPWNAADTQHRFRALLKGSRTTSARGQ